MGFSRTGWLEPAHDMSLIYAYFNMPRPEGLKELVNIGLYIVFPEVSDPPN